MLFGKLRFFSNVLRNAKRFLAKPFYWDCRPI